MGSNKVVGLPTQAQLPTNLHFKKAHLVYKVLQVLNHSSHAKVKYE